MMLCYCSIVGLTSIPDEKKGAGVKFVGKRRPMTMSQSLSHAGTGRGARLQRYNMQEKQSIR